MNKIMVKTILLLGISMFSAAPAFARWDSEKELNESLNNVLEDHGFTGQAQQLLEEKLGRKVDKKLAHLGGLLFHDNILALNNDNSCGGCHTAGAGYADTQSIAIGVDSNELVGPDRQGPRNMRRSPTVVNTALFPALMADGRFFSEVDDPFDSSADFVFATPEGRSLSGLSHLLVGQAFIPTVSAEEMAGFGEDVPATRDGIRDEVVVRLNGNQEYRKLFGKSYAVVRDGGSITYEMVGEALAEFQFKLTFADAPIDRFARGNKNAMSVAQKKGAMVFFGEAGCVQCHSVSGKSNEMFTDFESHVVGVPQIIPEVTNVQFNGPDENQDFGLENSTSNEADRYAFRTAPLRNIAFQPTFFHNGAYTSLEGAIRHHLDVHQSARNYDPVEAGVDEDLQGPMGPIEPVLQRVDPLLASPTVLTEEEIQWLITFVEEGLQDKHATPKKLRKLVPDTVPSGMPVQKF